MAATADITIVDFNLQRALEETPVTFISTDGVITDMNTQTGILRKKTDSYEVTINGVTYRINKKGKDYSTGNQLFLVEASMITTYGTSQGMTRGVGLGVRDLGVVSNLEPRDQFAILAMETMITHLDHPESVNDAAILLYSRAAYRWAQGMMIVAADNRAAVPVVEDTSVQVDTQSLNSNTEKLLNNIVDAVKKLTAQIKGDGDGGGVLVKGLSESLDIPNVGESINIKVSKFNGTYVRFEVVDEMAYSDISVYIDAEVKEGTTTGVDRKVGFVIPKGSVIIALPMDDAVTEITSIENAVIRGQGYSDENVYTIQVV